MRLRHLATVAVLVVTASACSSTDTPEEDAGAAASASSETTSGDVDAFLAEHGLEGMSATEIVEELDRSTEARPLAFGASVQADALLLADEEREVSLDLPEDEFYVSVAPYVDTTHDCYFHSLATCQGELTEEPMQVTITDGAGEVLVDEEVTTGSNGFAGFWLPRDISGTIEVTREGHTGAVDFATDADSPTCVTTLQLLA